MTGAYNIICTIVNFEVKMDQKMLIICFFSVSEGSFKFKGGKAFH